MQITKSGGGGSSRLSLRSWVDGGRDNDATTQVGCQREQKNTELEHLLWSSEEWLKVAVAQGSLVESSRGKELWFLFELEAGWWSDGRTRWSAP